MKQPLTGQIFVNHVGAVRIVERESADLNRVFWVKFYPHNLDDFVTWGACLRERLQKWGKRLDDLAQSEKIMEDYQKNRKPRLIAVWREAMINQFAMNVHCDVKTATALVDAITKHVGALETIIQFSGMEPVGPMAPEIRDAFKAAVKETEMLVGTKGLFGVVDE